MPSTDILEVLLLRKIMKNFIKEHKKKIPLWIGQIINSTAVNDLTLN